MFILLVDDPTCIFQRLRVKQPFNRIQSYNQAYQESAPTTAYGQPAYNLHSYLNDFPSGFQEHSIENRQDNLRQTLSQILDQDSNAPVSYTNKVREKLP